MKCRRRCHTPPLFGGHSRSTPQGMMLDVQPLAKSLFCPTKQSPKGPLKLDTIFWVGLGVGGGGVQKFVVERILTRVEYNKGSRSIDWLSRRSPNCPPGIKPALGDPSAGCSTARPLSVPAD